MSREIKFRTWFKDIKRMVITDQITLISPVYAMDDGGNVVTMQFTGLTDKNGKEIYEGDLLLVGKDEDHRFYPPVFVKWRNDRWVFASQQGGCWSFQDSYFGLDTMLATGNVVQVIGNIYETPE